ncbi:hypothetical protein J2W18_002439 [Rhodococcus cercidiphylli]|nr:hypothetical protein [Rhodococcus cercidiphylli]
MGRISVTTTHASLMSQLEAVSRTIDTRAMPKRANAIAPPAEVMVAPYACVVASLALR